MCLYILLLPKPNTPQRLAVSHVGVSETDLWITATDVIAELIGRFFNLWLDAPHPWRRVGGRNPWPKNTFLTFGHGACATTKNHNEINCNVLLSVSYDNVICNTINGVYRPIHWPTRTRDVIFVERKSPIPLYQ